jgi:MYXO-CTERM domain-containing protein
MDPMNHSARILGSAALLVLARPALAATLQVGPGKTYAKPCAAFAAAAQNDTITIDAAGNYDGDVCAIAPAGLTIRGVNGRAHIDAAGQNAQGKGIWVVQGAGITIENIEFSGATVVDHNGAGIRAEGNGLTIRNCYFHDNQEGILGGSGEVLIELSEFGHNGNCDDPSGCAHNMYLSNSVTKFTLRYSYTHSAFEGHLVKSRAQANYIISNRITGEDGTDSYEIDLPNAGTAYIIGNLIEQSSTTGNPTIVTYGEEGPSNAGKDLYVVNNTIVNDRSSGTFVNVDGRVTTPAVVKNNIFLGTGTAVSQAGATVANNFTGDPMLVNRAGYDYHLLAGSPCIGAGADPGLAGSFSLTPATQYIHPSNFETRPVVGVIDIGAYEFDGGQDGGAPGTGGAAGTGGATATGGASSGSGGNSSSGGSSNGGSGNTSRGGASGTAGRGGTGGATSGAGGSGVPDVPTDGGAAEPATADKGGCGCRAVGAAPRSPLGALAAVAVVMMIRKRRRAPPCGPRS